jgi:hypothetical protein
VTAPWWPSVRRASAATSSPASARRAVGGPRTARREPPAARTSANARRASMRAGSAASPMSTSRRAARRARRARRLRPRRCASTARRCAPAGWPRVRLAPVASWWLTRRASLGATPGHACRTHASASVAPRRQPPPAPMPRRGGRFRPRAYAAAVRAATRRWTRRASLGATPGHAGRTHASASVAPRRQPPPAPMPRRGGRFRPRAYAAAVRAATRRWTLHARVRRCVRWVRVGGMTRAFRV